MGGGAAAGATGNSDRTEEEEKEEKQSKTKGEARIIDFTRKDTNRRHVDR